MKKVKHQVFSIFFMLFVAALFTAGMFTSVGEAQAGVSSQKIAAGTPYATDLYIIRSSKPGPVVMIVGGVHGNEPAGYKAARNLRDYRISRGTLIVLPEANRQAVSRGARTGRDGRDLNRAFPKQKGESADTTLSKSIYWAVKNYKVDWLVDLHEGYDYSAKKSSSSVGQSLIYYPNTTTKSVASYIVKGVNQNISTSYRRFQLYRYPIKGSLAYSAAKTLGVNSFIFETCSQQTMNTRINYHLKAVNILLNKLGMN